MEAKGIAVIVIITREAEDFLVVARYQSLKVASEHLFISVPALSQQMKKLEYTVGVPLLARNNRGMTLTPAGEVFLEKMKQIKKLEEEALLLTRRADNRPFPDSSSGETDGTVSLPEK